MIKLNLWTDIISELGFEFYDPVKASSFPEARLRYYNPKIAQAFFGEGTTLAENLKKYFWEFQPIPQSLPQSLALRYHGHQFGHYNPDLGDGRGFLHAQIWNQGRLFDFGTKGSGQTPYSRNGDGRLTLKGAYREALCTELLESLGVRTSRTLCFFETGESLIRYDEPSPTRAAVLTRFSHSHIRIGTFQRLAYLQKPDLILKLTEYVLNNLYENPSDITSSTDLSITSAPTLARQLLRQVVNKNAELCAQIMMAGFVHGVLNTDNLSITGEVFDFGPYRFLPEYNPHFTAAYFDQSGMYCYGRQPPSFLFGLEQLAESLKLIDPDLNIEEELSGFGPLFNKYLLSIFLKRLNLQSQGTDSDSELLARMFQWMDVHQGFFEQTFFDAFGGDIQSRVAQSPQKELYQGPEFENWWDLLRTYKVQDLEKMKHPYFAQKSPETLLIDEIEKIWQPISQRDDWTAFTEKIERIRSMRGVYVL